MKTNSKKNIKNRLISAICVLLMVVTTMTVVAPIAASAADVATAAVGYETIKALGANTQIGPRLSKETNAKYSSIFFYSNVDTFKVYFWVYDYTRGTTISSKKQFTVTSTEQKKWLPYKDGAVCKLNDQVIIYGEQYALTTKGIHYVTYGGQAAGGSL